MIISQLKLGPLNVLWHKSIVIDRTAGGVVGQGKSSNGNSPSLPTTECNLMTVA